jgi:hypothetical protein
VSLIVFAHHFSEPHQRDFANSFKCACAFQFFLAQASQRPHVFSSRFRKRLQREVCLLIVVVALSGHARAIEISQSGITFVKQQLNSRCITLYLEVSQVAEILKRREFILRILQTEFAYRQSFGKPGESVWRFVEKIEQRCEVRAIKVSFFVADSVFYRAAPG